MHTMFVDRNGMTTMEFWCKHSLADAYAAFYGFPIGAAVDYYARIRKNEASHRAAKAALHHEETRHGTGETL
jgi:hypothetical protein